MKKLLLTSTIAFGLILLSMVASAQSVGKIDFKVDGFTQKKFNNTEKKIYIQDFFVKYQLMMS